VCGVTRFATTDY